MADGTQLTGLFGALLMTLGMFIPAFVLPVCLHDTLERAIATKGLFPKALDAVAATVVGQIAVTACLMAWTILPCRCNTPTPLALTKYNGRSARRGYLQTILLVNKDAP